MRRLRRLMPVSLPDWAVAVLVSLAVAGIVLGLRAVRVLEPAELALYDRFLLIRAPGADAPADPRVLVVTITERDIQEQGAWPLPDGVLARTLNTLLRLGPRAIGLDVYRDVPIAPGTAELDYLLREHPVVVVTKFGEGGLTGVAPPAAVKGTDKVGFNDVVVDSGGTVRRVLMFLDDGQTALYSFGLRLALQYLAPDGIGLGADPKDETVVRLGRTSILPLAASDGPYVGLDARGYQFLADYGAGARPFERATLGAVLQGEVTREMVHNRVVLVGVTAESVKDDFYTPLSAARHPKQHVPGVEVHAHFVSQLLRIALHGDRPLWSPPIVLTWVWVLLWSGLGAFLGIRTLKARVLTVAFLVGLVIIVTTAYLAFVNGVWWSVVPPALSFSFATGFVIAYHSYRESAERGTLMRIFSQHVSKEVAEDIWRDREQFAGGGRPQPRRLIVTAFFTDLTGFTTVSEAFTPEQLMDWLNEYMGAMAPVISRHGGVIRQYAGDSIVALFGVPVPRRSEDEIARDAINAVRCAVALEQRLLEMNRAWQEAGKPVTGMRIGIVTGEAVSGTLGSTERWEYVVVGDTLNTASRLESFDKDVYPPDPLIRPCRTLIGQSTHAYVGDLFETEWVAEARLKGKQQLVAIYRVLGERAPVPVEAPAAALVGSGPSRAAEPPRATPSVAGRGLPWEVRQ
ncbi:MAG TPA: adenylate/guanylate cyclase domain-containing protein [Methylomirabilota bacterium]|nr:adenylate/guanylate cyclase domain-containing protein [Methylomirabilota bacterium]